MKTEYDNLLQTVEEFDAYLSGFDIRNPAGFCGTRESDPKWAKIDGFRLKLTERMAAAGTPKAPDESVVRRRCLVQIQFIWMLTDFICGPQSIVTDTLQDTVLRYKCICRSFKNGEKFSECIDFDTIAWVRTTSIARLKKQIENGEFKGRLNPGKYSPYYGLENCDVGPQIFADICMYDLNPSITEKLYAGANIIKFINERIYTIPKIKRVLQINDAAEKYWFLHIYNDEDEIRFRIRAINAFKDSLHIIYAVLCMRDHQYNAVTDAINSDVVDEHGITELMKAYKVMYYPLYESAGFLYRGESPQEKSYMGVFRDIYSEMERTLVSDGPAAEFQKGLLAAAGTGTGSAARFRLADEYMKLSDKAQKSIRNVFAAEPPFDWNKFRRAVSYFAAPQSASLEDYTAETADDIIKYMAVHEKLENCFDSKLSRCSDIFRGKYSDIIEEILSDPVSTLEIAFENKL